LKNCWVPSKNWQSLNGFGQIFDFFKNILRTRVIYNNQVIDSLITMIIYRVFDFLISMMIKLIPLSYPDVYANSNARPHSDMPPGM